MVFSLLSYTVAAVSLAWSVSALEVDMNVVNAQISPDGFARSAVLADGVYPGPLLTATKGEDFKVNVINQLNDSSMLQGTSLHWHGFFQAGTNWADGPAMVNQCPIVPSHSFLYDFNVGDQTGSYWYHSHYSTQYCDGLRGPIVVYDPNDPHASLYDVDDASTVITLSDWYHTPAPSAGALPNPDSHLINGLGRWNNGGTIDATPLSVISVQAGQRYRFRLISLACDVNYVFSIDGHTMTIIEADGVSTDPLEVDSLQIFAAQRYSIVVTANNETAGNFWIRARPNKGDTSFTSGLNSAILRYAGADEVEPTTTQDTSVNALVEADLHTLNHPGVPGGAEAGSADVVMSLPVGFVPADLEFTLNGTSYKSPSVPVLLQILSGVSDPTQLLPSGSVISLPANKVIEISIPGGGNHPFHLHGHNFDVIRSAGSTSYNFVNPVRRDVVTIGVAGDLTTIRFTTDNPGPWFFHCHIEWHLEAGLAVVFAEDTESAASANPVPQAWQDLCPTFDSENPDA